MDIRKKWLQEDWNRDINAYYRWKQLVLNTQSQLIKEKGEQKMEEIRKRWPNHQKQFTS